jgi:hypothetical protein
MKKSDIILMISIVFVSLLGYGILRVLLVESTTKDGKAIVYYHDDVILEIFLEDGSYSIIDEDNVISIDEDNFLYTVSGSDGNVVVIEYNKYRVRVIEEVSPQNICQIQSWSSSPLRPITCLPNNLVIIIEDDLGNDEPDDISS